MCSGRICREAQATATQQGGIPCIMDDHEILLSSLDIMEYCTCPMSPLSSFARIVPVNHSELPSIAGMLESTHLINLREGIYIEWGSAEASLLKCDVFVARVVDQAMSFCPLRKRRAYAGSSIVAHAFDARTIPYHACHSSPQGHRKQMLLSVQVVMARVEKRLTFKFVIMDVEAK
ncbi:hypothetical protein SeMB42_g00570 [Synchytrium endobioticum]|uniref:Uncharacterized protein n=1 Tax=Synchytrium endobioticum TaxID=286115 RepID=A0A507DRN8_9FUNG|nr:hypothetical protein SeMB42_g00570 [Synchytrium endobioticum]